MLSRTVCAGFAVFSALVGMANLAAADRSDLRPIGVCIDKPGTGTFVGVAVWTSCNDADGTARTKARGFAEGFARNGCGGSLTAAEGRMICAGRGGILVTTTPYLSNTNNYAISINAPHGFCSRIQDGDLKPTFSSTKKCGTQPPSWWHGPWWGNWAEQTATATNHGYVCSR